MREGMEYRKLTEMCDILYGYPFDSSHFSLSPENILLTRFHCCNSLDHRSSAAAMMVVNTMFIIIHMFKFPRLL